VDETKQLLWRDPSPTVICRSLNKHLATVAETYAPSWPNVDTPIVDTSPKTFDVGSAAAEAEGRSRLEAP